MYYSSNQGPVITPTLIVLWQMTSIWLSLQNVSVAESSRWPSTSFRISTFGSCCKLILSLVAEHITDLRTEHNNFMLLKLFEVPCHLLFSFYSALGWEPHFHRRFSPNTSVSVLKAEEVRFTDIHFAWRVFHLKLLQIRTGSDLTCVPQSLDHCLKLLAIVLFFPSLTLFLFSFLLPCILLNNDKLYGDELNDFCAFSHCRYCWETEQRSGEVDGLVVEAGNQVSRDSIQFLAKLEIS